MSTKILIGSVLKPVDDVRHYHKIAKSLAKKNTEIHIFGYPSGAKSELENVVFHPTKKFNRISITRIFIGIRFFLLGLKLKPDIIISCTHELLKSSFFIKLFTHAKVIYDVQENYYRNIIYTNSFPILLRYPIAWLVRMNEWISSIMIDNYLLAEKCYLEELPFVNDRNSTVLENKFVARCSMLDARCSKSEASEAKLRHSKFQITNHTCLTGRQESQISSKTLNPKFQTSNFLITGTLGLHYGTHEGINFFKKINKIKPESSLSIVGICRDKSLQSSVLSPQSSMNKILIDNKPIPHSKIIEIFESGGIALLPYQPNTSTKNRIPTKFYEYLYYRIPMIVQENSIWEKLLNPYKAAIFIDFRNFDAEEVLKQIETFDFYSGQEPGDEILWEDEETKLHNVLKNFVLQASDF